MYQCFHTVKRRSYPLYIGSVKFFKHLIITVVLLLITVPTALCIVFGVSGAEKDREISSLKAEIAVLKGEAPENSDNPDNTGTTDNPEETAPVIADTKEPLPITTTPEETPGKDGDVTDATTTLPEEAEGGEVSDSTTAPQAEEREEADEKVSYELLYPELYALGTGDIQYKEDKDHVYLTFDDGPSKYTENILYYLDLYEIKATFFVVPDGTETCNNRLKRIAEEGHTIGIHTACHEYDKIYSSVESYLDDFNLAYNRIYEATGIKCNLFRFPGGSKNDYNKEHRDEIIEEMTRRGFIYFDWNVDSRDAMGADWTEMYNTVLSETADVPRAIILMHDYNGGYNTILVLEDIIRALIADSRNFTMDKLSEAVRPIQF